MSDKHTVAADDGSIPHRTRREAFDVRVHRTRAHDFNLTTLSLDEALDGKRGGGINNPIHYTPFSRGEFGTR